MASWPGAGARFQTLLGLPNHKRGVRQAAVLGEGTL